MEPQLARLVTEIETGRRPIDGEGCRDRARTGGQELVGQGGQPCRHELATGIVEPAAGQGPVEARKPHLAQAGDGFNGANEDRGRSTGRFGDHVEAVVHAVDKVHIGQSGRSVHDRVAGGPAEPGVARLVLLADVCLDLDDATDARFVTADLPDETDAQQVARGLEARTGEGGSREGRQVAGATKRAAISEGTSGPSRANTAGRMSSRYTAAVAVGS